MSSYNNIVMSQKVDLNKLSPQELIAYVENLKKQQANQSSKKVIQPPKPVTTKSITVEPSTKLLKLLSSSGKVLHYPKEIVSIAQMRDEELNMASVPGKMKMTFAELFDRR